MNTGHLDRRPTATTVSPLVSRVTGGEAALRRSLHTGRVPLSFTLGAHDLTAMVATPADIAAMVPIGQRLPVRFGDAVGQLALSPTLIRLLLDMVAPGIATDHPDLDLLLELALSQPLEALEGMLGLTISLLPSGEKPPADLHPIGLRILRDGFFLGVAALRVGIPQAQSLTEALNRLPANATDIDHLPQQVLAEAGSTLLSVTVLRSLGRGDILLSDESLSDGTVRLRIGRRHAFIAAQTDHGYQIITAADGPNQDSDMEDSPEPAAEAQSLDDLAVRVVFEAARLDLPLGELRKMRPGYVLDLNRPVGLTVDLTVRGQIVGRAELVQVDDSLGARIVRLFEHE